MKSWLTIYPTWTFCRAYTLRSLRIIDFVILEIFDLHWQRNTTYLDWLYYTMLLWITTQINYCNQLCKRWSGTNVEGGIYVRQNKSNTCTYHKIYNTYRFCIAYKQYYLNIISILLLILLTFHQISAYTAWCFDIISKYCVYRFDLPVLCILWVLIIKWLSEFNPMISCSFASPNTDKRNLLWNAFDDAICGTRAFCPQKNNTFYWFILNITS